MADEHPVISSDSMFLKAILPTLNVSPCNPLTITGGAGSSTVTAAAFAGGSSSPAPLQVLVFQQQSTGNGNVEISFNSNASPMAMWCPAAGCSLAEGAFSYQGPLPPSMRNHINLLLTALPLQIGIAMDKGKAPLIELPYGIPMDDFLVGQTAYGGAGPSIEAPDATAAAYPYIDALNNNVAAGSLMASPMEPTFSITEPTVLTQGEGSETNAVATTRNNAAPLMVPDQVTADAAMDAEEDIMFSLESLLGLDYDMLPMEDSSAAEAAAADDSAGMDIGWDLDLHDILVENANDFVFLDSIAGSE
ncbi:hypothetical protein OsJ_27568 [Oryza sativa Japonica Group]|nr:hypothetical protein OsJ_27568 [Oryza sativa Japonica Group]